MIKLTQTDLIRGNCIQTCIASLLEIDPSSMPAQENYDHHTFNTNGARVYRYYTEAIKSYLKKHHGLCWLRLELPEEAVCATLQVKEPGWHLISGNTVRTAATGNTHMVVGRFGQIEWDPHPSRAGLLDDGERKWSFLMPWPSVWNRAHLIAPPCECPACATTNLVGGGISTLKTQ